MKVSYPTIGASLCAAFLVLFAAAFAATPWPNFLPGEIDQARAITGKAHYLEQVNAYVADPYVRLRPYDFQPMAVATQVIQIQDLRGNDCFAQPDILQVCGAADTIPILLFTKSEDPIFDVELNVNFGPGLEYGGFAYVDTDNADLDTINVDNLGSPTFRISEISQAGEAVVVYNWGTRFLRY